MQSKYEYRNFAASKEKIIFNPKILSMRSIIFTFVFALAVGGVAIAKETKATEQLSQKIKESYQQIQVEVFGKATQNS